MTYTIFYKMAAVSLLMCLSACDKPTNQMPTSTSSASSLVTPSPNTNADAATSIETTTDKWATTDTWKGKWNGPEGTFLQIDGGAGNYNLTIQNLDGPLTYTGIGVGEEIQFERNGIKETIHASNGAQTGMKWLSDKSNCLTIRVGEGYCKK